MTTDAIELVVGLGNPGPGHAGDRLTAGFWFVDALAARLGVDLRGESRYKGELGRAPSGLLEAADLHEPVGRERGGLRELLPYSVRAVLVVRRTRSATGRGAPRRGGGHGGHNGLRSSIATWPAPTTCLRWASAILTGRRCHRLRAGHAASSGAHLHRGRHRALPGPSRPPARGRSDARDEQRIVARRRLRNNVHGFQMRHRGPAECGKSSLFNA